MLSVNDLFLVFVLVDIMFIASAIDGTVQTRYCFETFILEISYWWLSVVVGLVHLMRLVIKGGKYKYNNRE